MAAAEAESGGAASTDGLQAGDEPPALDNPGRTHVSNTGGGAPGPALGFQEELQAAAATRARRSLPGEMAGRPRIWGSAHYRSLWQAAVELGDAAEDSGNLLGEGATGFPEGSGSQPMPRDPDVLEESPLGVDSPTISAWRPASNADSGELTDTPEPSRRPGPGSAASIELLARDAFSGPPQLDTPLDSPAIPAWRPASGSPTWSSYDSDASLAREDDLLERYALTRISGDTAEAPASGSQLDSPRGIVTEPDEQQRPQHQEGAHDVHFESAGVSASGSGPGSSAAQAQHAASLRRVARDDSPLQEHDRAHRVQPRSNRPRVAVGACSVSPEPLSRRDSARDSLLEARQAMLLGGEQPPLQSPFWGASQQEVRPRRASWAGEAGARPDAAQQWGPPVLANTRPAGERPGSHLQPAGGPSEEATTPGEMGRLGIVSEGLAAQGATGRSGFSATERRLHARDASPMASGRPSFESSARAIVGSSRGSPSHGECDSPIDLYLAAALAQDQGREARNSAGAWEASAQGQADGQGSRTQEQQSAQGSGELPQTLNRQPPAEDTSSPFRGSLPGQARPHRTSSRHDSAGSDLLGDGPFAQMLAPAAADAGLQPRRAPLLGIQASRTDSARIEGGHDALATPAARELLPGATWAATSSRPLRGRAALRRTSRQDSASSQSEYDQPPQRFRDPQHLARLSGTTVVAGRGDPAPAHNAPPAEPWPAPPRASPVGPLPPPQHSRPPRRQDSASSGFFGEMDRGQSGGLLLTGLSGLSVSSSSAPADRARLATPRQDSANSERFREARARVRGQPSARGGSGGGRESMRAGGVRDEDELEAGVTRQDSALTDTLTEARRAVLAEMADEGAGMAEAGAPSSAAPMRHGSPGPADDPQVLQRQDSALDTLAEARRVVLHDLAEHPQPRRERSASRSRIGRAGLRQQAAGGAAAGVPSGVDSPRGSSPLHPPSRQGSLQRARAALLSSPGDHPQAGQSASGASSSHSGPVSGRQGPRGGGSLSRPDSPRSTLEGVRAAVLADLSAAPPPPPQHGATAGRSVPRRNSHRQLSGSGRQDSGEIEIDASPVSREAGPPREGTGNDLMAARRLIAAAAAPPPPSSSDHGWGNDGDGPWSSGLGASGEASSSGQQPFAELTGQGAAAARAGRRAWVRPELSPSPPRQRRHGKGLRRDSAEDPLVEARRAVLQDLADNPPQQFLQGPSSVASSSRQPPPRVPREQRPRNDSPLQPIVLARQALRNPGGASAGGAASPGHVLIGDVSPSDSPRSGIQVSGSVSRAGGRGSARHSRRDPGQGMFGSSAAGPSTSNDASAHAWTENDFE